MSIILFLVSGAVFVFIFVFWTNQFQAKENIDEVSSNLTPLAPVRTTSIWSPTALAPGRTISPTWLPRSSTASLSVSNLSRDILNNFPHSTAMQKRILVNLRIVEYKLVELEHFLIIKGFNDSPVKGKATEQVTRCNVDTGNH